MIFASCLWRTFFVNPLKTEWFSSWWLNQPLWKICEPSNVIMKPQGSGWKFQKVFELGTTYVMANQPTPLNVPHQIHKGLVAFYCGLGALTSRPHTETPRLRFPLHWGLQLLTCLSIARPVLKNQTFAKTVLLGTGVCTPPKTNNPPLKIDLQEIP